MLVILLAQGCYASKKTSTVNFNSSIIMLEIVNKEINKSIVYKSDIDNLGKIDYWSTPEESRRIGFGDCEDYAIAKYFKLSKKGFDVKKLEITYVTNRNLKLPHMVLAYYPEQSDDPIILDNRYTRTYPASQRKEMIPEYQFNEYYFKKMNGSWRAGNNIMESYHIDKWRDVMLRHNNQ